MNKDDQPQELPPEEWERIFEHMPQELRVMESGIDAQTMMDFAHFRQEMSGPEDEPLNPLPAPQAVLALPPDMQKHVAVRIADVGSVEAFRLLEQLQTQVSTELQAWFSMACLHCRMRLENDLMDEPVGFIATGMGGKGDKIRYYMALRTKNRLPFEAGQLRWLEQECRRTALEMGAEIESFDASERYAELLLLLSWQKTIMEFIEQSVQNCDFIDHLFWISNVAKPSAAELQPWLEHE